MSPYTSTDHLRAGLDAGVLRITLDKVRKKNALDDDMVAGLIRHLHQANSDEAVRAVLLSGAGDSFCSGFDIVSRNAGNERPRVGSIQRRLPAQAHELIPTMLETQVPIVVSARGWTAGIGLNLAVAADFAVVAHDANIWAPFAARGMSPDSGAAWMIPQAVGRARANELLLLGRRIDGRIAAEWGLVHASVDSEELDATAEALVKELAAGPTVALGLAKWLMHTGASSSLRTHLANEGFAMEISSRSEDFNEGLKAFVEKRSPLFRGR